MIVLLIHLQAGRLTPLWYRVLGDNASYERSLAKIIRLAHRNSAILPDPRMWIGGPFLLWYALCMIYLATDHRGFQLKESIKKFLAGRGIEAEDTGAFAYAEEDDYTDFAAAAATKISQNPLEHKGIFICGSGHGVDIVANKFRGIRAALCWNTAVAKQSREHEDANVLVLPTDWLDARAAEEIIAAWLGTPAGNEERHKRRIEKIQDIEKRNG